MMAGGRSLIGKSPDGVKLTDRQRIILSRIVEDPSELAEEMAKALGIGRRTLDRDTAVLRKLGYIKKSGKDNKSPWMVLK